MLASASALLSWLSAGPLPAGHAHRDFHGIAAVSDVIKFGSADAVNRVERIGRSTEDDRVVVVNRHSARSGVRRDGDVITDEVGVIFEVPV